MQIISSCRDLGQPLLGRKSDPKLAGCLRRRQWHWCWQLAEWWDVSKDPDFLGSLLSRREIGRYVLPSVCAVLLFSDAMFVARGIDSTAACSSMMGYSVLMLGAVCATWCFDSRSMWGDILLLPVMAFSFTATLTTITEDKWLTDVCYCLFVICYWFSALMVSGIHSTVTCSGLVILFLTLEMVQPGTWWLFLGLGLPTMVLSMILHRGAVLVYVLQRATDSFMTEMCTGVCMVSLDDGIVVEASASLEELFGGADLVGKKFVDLCGGDLKLQSVLSKSTRLSDLEPCFTTCRAPELSKVFDCKLAPFYKTSHTVRLSLQVLGELRDDLGPMEAQCQDEDVCDIGLEHRDECHSLMSVPMSTASGRMFGLVQRLFREGATRCEVDCGLRQVAEMGEREHWRIRPEQLQVDEHTVIGAGSFGVVVLGSFRGTHVAVKMPKLGHFDHQSTRTRSVAIACLLNEIGILRHVHHPNIITFYGATVDTDCLRLTLVLELIHGITLHKYVRNGLCCGSQPWSITLQLTLALRYLHEHSPVVIHGDFKTSNMMIEQLDSGPRPKLLDFGLARVLTRGQPRKTGGTWQYAAPELLLGSQPRPSADVFSLGHVMYYVGTSWTPCRGIPLEVVRGLAQSNQVPELLWPQQPSPFAVACKPLVEAIPCFDAAARPSIAAAQAAIDRACVGLLAEGVQAATEVAAVAATEDLGGGWIEEGDEVDVWSLSSSDLSEEACMGSPELSMKKALPELRGASSSSAPSAPAPAKPRGLMSL
mmetsp:Transcript_50007/g.161781  ORF Transcript_50007/g.161781 Transcript_50007/m.161781 type:complete len:764 (-) Transcript_50007:170-2461(-)